MELTLLTPISKGQIRENVFNHSVLELIEKGVFTPPKKPYSKDFTIFKKCECCGNTDIEYSGKENYRAAIKRYRKAAAIKHELFKYACCIELQIEYGTAQTNKAFEMAWDRGHHAGLHEVYYALQDLAALLHLDVSSRG
jgi:hypothetical protein